MIDLTALTFVDYSVVLVLVISAICSTLRGMTREFLGLVGWLASVLVANNLKPFLEEPIADLINADRLSAALAWTLPFAATVILWFLLASLLSPGLTRAGLGNLDRWLGVIFGVIRGYLLVLLTFIAAVLTMEGENKLPIAIKKAQTTPIFSQGARYFARFAPDDFRDKLLSKLLYHGDKRAHTAQATDKIIESGTEILKKPLELLSDETDN